MLILDEPTYGQDIRGIEAIFDIIGSLMEREDLAVIINTNDIEVAKAFSNKIIHLKNGEIKKVDILGE